MEATIAIIILAGVLIVIYSANRLPADIADSVYIIQEDFLRDIENSYNYRQFVLENDTSNLSNLASTYFPSYLNYTILVCDLSGNVNPCRLDNVTFLDVKDKNVYVSETIIATNITNYSPKKLKIFSWEI